ncbi:MAG: hypothetical protein AAF092_15680 [Pseudomonadota bacterium]
MTLAWAGLLALGGCVQRALPVTAELPGGTVTLTVTPLFGLHSDWERSLRVTNSDGRMVEEALFEDRGWWRGSHLYWHGSGVYVLHEGQLGCTGLRIDPPAIGVRVNALCAKAPVGVSERPAARGYPASRFYAELYYVGRFVERHMVPELRDEAGEVVVFQSYEEAAEGELPDPI